MFGKVLDKLKGGSEAPSKEPNLDEIMGAPLEPEGDEGMGGGGDLMGALSGAGYTPTPEQIKQIEDILKGGPGNASPIPGGADAGHAEPDGDEGI